jgi:hypothetical protein
MSHVVAEPPAHSHLLSEELYISSDPQQPSKPHAAGQAFQYVIAQIGEAARHYWAPITRQRESLESRFQRLAQAWRAAVGPTSSLTQMAMHPAYQQIIGMGRDAIPLLLRELEREPDHWFWALKAITGVDPVDPGLKGRLDEMAGAWLKWGKEQSFRW